MQYSCDALPGDRRDKYSSLHPSNSMVLFSSCQTCDEKGLLKIHQSIIGTPRHCPQGHLVNLKPGKNKWKEPCFICLEKNNLTRQAWK